MHCLRLTKECSYPPQQRRKRTVNPRNTDFTPDCNASVEEVARGSDDATRTVSPKTSEQNRYHLPATATEGTISVSGSDPAIGMTTELPKSTISPGTSTARGVRPQQNLSPRFDTAEKLVDLSPTGLSISDDSFSTPGRSQGGDGPRYKEQDSSTWLSTCSEAGVSWVCDATGSRTFAKCVDRFIRSMDQLLSPRSGLVLHTQGIEPSEALAWEYVNGKYLSSKYPRDAS
jgi:hypothetical protein